MGASLHLVVVLAVYVASRVWLWLRLPPAPMRFDYWGWHLMDPVLLKERLAETLLYLHAQPPLYNALIGLVLKGAPGWESVAVRLIYHGLGFLTAWALFRLMVDLGVRAGLATVIVVGYLLSPASLLYESVAAYDHLNMATLVLSAFCFQRFMTHRTLGWAAAFFGCVSALALSRPLFHLVWVVAVVAGTWWLARRWEPRQRRTLLVAALPVALVLAVYLKNAVLFQHFSASTWMGMNIARITLMQAAPEERDALIQQGALSPVAHYAPFRPLDEYPAVWRQVTPTGVPVLDQPAITTSGLPNFNHLAYITLSDQFMRDNKALVRQQPSAYAKGLLRAHLYYVIPAEENMFIRDGLRRLHPWGVVYLQGIYWRWVPVGTVAAALPASVPDKARAMAEAFAPKLSLSLMLVVPLLLVFGARQWWRTRRGEDPVRWITLTYLLASIAFVTVVGNALEAGENYRFRYLVDPFYLILLGLALQASATRLRHLLGR